MEYDVKFPDMANYDIKKPGEMALYHAHCDFMPFRSVIETTQVSLSAMREYYHEHTEKAREVGDYVTEEWAMTSGMLYTARAIPLSYYSLVLVMVSLLEEAFNTLCRAYCIINKYQIVQKDMAGQGLERAVNYLEKVASVRGIKSDTQWEYVKTIRDARNMVVHNGGRVTGKKMRTKSSVSICMKKIVGLTLNMMILFACMKQLWSLLIGFLEWNLPMK